MGAGRKDRRKPVLFAARRRGGVVFHHGNAALCRRNPPSWRGGFSAAKAAGELPPPLFFVPKKSRRGRWKRNVFCLGFRCGAPLVALRLRSARGRSIDGRRGVQFYRRLSASSTAHIAARPVWSVFSETIASSRANLRQQGVAESLLVLGGTLVNIAHNANRTRAAQ